MRWVTPWVTPDNQRGERGERPREWVQHTNTKPVDITRESRRPREGGHAGGTQSVGVTWGFVGDHSATLLQSVVVWRGRGGTRSRLQVTVMWVRPWLRDSGLVNLRRGQQP